MAGRHRGAAVAVKREPTVQWHQRASVEAHAGRSHCVGRSVLGVGRGQLPRRRNRFPPCRLVQRRPVVVIRSHLPVQGDPLSAEGHPLPFLVTGSGGGRGGGGAGGAGRRTASRGGVARPRRRRPRPLAFAPAVPVRHVQVF